MTSLGECACRFWISRDVSGICVGRNVIGRDPTCDVCIDHAPISRQHAAITLRLMGPRSKDLASKNGTYARGSRISSTADLMEGDPVRFGEGGCVSDGNSRTPQPHRRRVTSPSDRRRACAFRHFAGVAGICRGTSERWRDSRFTAELSSSQDFSKARRPVHVAESS